MNNRLFFILILTVVLLFGCVSNRKFPNEKQEFIDVYLEQDEKKIHFIENTAGIKKSSFRFVFRSSDPDSFLINTSFSPDSFNIAISGAPLDMIPGLAGSGLAEEPFNAEYSMFISSDSPNYWYYANSSDSRFDSIVHDETGYTFLRTISCIIDLDRNGEKKDIAKISENTIYVIIVKMEWNYNFTKRIEKARRSLKIQFIQ